MGVSGGHSKRQARASPRRRQMNLALEQLKVELSEHRQMHLHWAYFITNNVNRFIGMDSYW